IEVPENVGNLNWGGDDWQMLYMPSTSSLYRIRMKVSGNRLSYMKGGGDRERDRTAARGRAHAVGADRPGQAARSDDGPRRAGRSPATTSSRRCACVAGKGRGSRCCSQASGATR